MKTNGSFDGKIDDSGLIISITQRNSNQIVVTSYHWPALFLLFCCAIGTERRLHNRTNWFLFSLALADLVISGIVIPLATVKEFTGRGK
jgi:hypothetical protein